MQIEQLKTKELKPYENNPRKNNAAVDAVAASIRNFGFRVPIVVDADNIIVCGHTRWKAAKKLGLKEVPVIRADDLTDEQIRAFRLADNKTAELAEWDDERLEEELAAITIDMTEFGFEEPEEEDPEPQEDDYEPKPPATPRTERGQIWILGDHRLMVGDASDPEDMDALFEGEQPDMVFTDPPYGVAIGSKNKAINEIEPGRGGRIEEDIEGDTLSTDQLYDLLVAAFSNLKDHCSDAASYYVSSPQGGELALMMMMRDAGLPVRHMLIWAKSSAAFSMGRLDYDYRHEPIFYTWTQSHNFRGGYDTTVIDDNKRLEDMSKAELKDLVHALRRDGQTSVIYCDKPHQSDLHPTMKPIKLIARFIHNSSAPGDLVADVFGGSGSTMIACEQLNRRCYMMEIDPHYADVIIDRWELFTGRKAELYAQENRD